MCVCFNVSSRDVWYINVVTVIILCDIIKYFHSADSLSSDDDANNIFTFKKRLEFVAYNPFVHVEFS